MLVDWKGVDVRYDGTHADAGRVHQVVRIRVCHEHANAGGSVAYGDTKEGAITVTNDHNVCFLVLVLVRVDEHGLPTERTRAFFADDPFANAFLADGVSARVHAIQCLLKTDGTLLHHSF